MSLEGMFSLAKKKALVAGASRGIGLAIAKGLAAAGANTILSSRSIEKLEKEALILREKGFTATAERLDVTDSDRVAELAMEHPDVDILINVAGTNLRKKFEEYTDEEYDHILATNLHGLARVTRCVGSNMIARQKGGKIVTIGSLTSTLGLPYLSIYGITKSALAGLTRGLAVEWASYDIQVNCIAPGSIDFPGSSWDRFQQNSTPEQVAEFIDRNLPAGKFGWPEPIGDTVAFLASENANLITGTCLNVDGGQSRSLF